MCFYVKNYSDAICDIKSNCGLYLDGSVVITKLLLTTCFPYVHKDAFNATAMNPKCNVKHVTAYYFV